jgi:hypothetical protein
MNFTDEDSHFIQNEMDLLIDMISEKKSQKIIMKKAKFIRNIIPCDCGQSE